MDKRGDGKRGEMHLVGRKITDGRRQEDTDWIKAYGRGGGGVLQELTAAVSSITGRPTCNCSPRKFVWCAQLRVTLSAAGL